MSTAKPSPKFTRRRGCVHCLCALILAAVAASLMLDAQPTIVMAAQIPLRAPSAFVLYRPDGRALVTESHDKDTYTIDFWDAESGQSMGQLPHESKVIDAAFSLDGHTFVTGSSDSADVWNLQTQKRVFKLQAPAAGTISQVAVSPNGQWIATQSGATITVWDTNTGQQVQQSDDAVLASARFVVSPDSAAIAYLEHDDAGNALCIWRLQSQGDERCFDTHEDQPSSVAWSPDGRQIALGGKQGTQVWQLQDGSSQKITYLDSDQTAVVSDIAYSPLDPLIAMSGGTLPILLRNSQNGAKVAEFGLRDPGHRCFWQNLAFAPDGHALALQFIVADDSASVQIWKPSAGHW